MEQRKRQIKREGMRMEKIRDTFMRREEREKGKNGERNKNGELENGKVK
jgi:hypothetical protein